MKKLWVALAVVGATLAAAGGAAANLSVGVNDDASKDPTVAPWFYSTMDSVDKFPAICWRKFLSLRETRSWPRAKPLAKCCNRSRRRCLCS